MPLRVLNWRRSAYALACAAILWLLLWSLPITSIVAGGALERLHPYHSATALPQAQAIVVLGGNTAHGRQNWFLPFDGSSAIQRIDTAAALYHAGRAPLVIVSGAALDGGMSEAAMMANSLQRHGVPAAAIIQESHSLTTRENASYSSIILREKNIQSFLLVSSALHMPRAMASFRSLGLAPTAAPSPPQILAPLPTSRWFLWLPNGRSLGASRTIIKEYIALLVYYLRGWA